MERIITIVNMLLPAAIYTEHNTTNKTLSASQSYTLLKVWRIKRWRAVESAPAMKGVFLSVCECVFLCTVANCFRTAQQPQTMCVVH